MCHRRMAPGECGPAITWLVWHLWTVWDTDCGAWVVLDLPAVVSQNRCGNSDARGTNASGMHWVQGFPASPSCGASTAALGCELFSCLSQRTHAHSHTRRRILPRASMDTDTPLRPHTGVAAGCSPVPEHAEFTPDTALASRCSLPLLGGGHQRKKVLCLCTSTGTWLVLEVR